MPPAGGIRVPTREQLAADIAAAWAACRLAVESGDKSVVRSLHLEAKSHDSGVSYTELRRDLTKLRAYFPQPSSISPSRIDPVLIPVIHQKGLEARLFRVARGYWSMPYSKGYGRRLRFLVMDQHHEAVIGVLGLQSPSADLSCRDAYLGVGKDRKLLVVNSTMDAYTVGAVPAYAPLLAGKLVAGLLHSPVIRQAYWRVYGAKRTTQLSERIQQPLLAITTASAFGRSSIYNRLRFHNQVLAKPLGYTRGFGTLHLESIYPGMVAWLKANDRHVPAGFGNGPKVRWQNIMRTLYDLGIPREYLSHGLKREVFLFELATNLIEVVRSGELPVMNDFDDARWGAYWRERWCLPRVSRTPEWAKFDAFETLMAGLGG